MEINITNYVNAVKFLAKSCNPNFPKYERWINRWYSNYFDDERFRAAYVIQLYEKRIDRFYELLADLGNSFYGPLVKQDMKDNNGVYSFCCGAGPEIVAYIKYVRNTLHSDQELNIVGVDVRDEWEKYIDLVRRFDQNSTIRFMQAEICKEFIRQMRNDSGVCIMSYPQSKNFEDIWNIIRGKFSLIIVLDQDRDDMFKLTEYYEFERNTFKLNKPYFYFIKRDCNHNNERYGKCQTDIDLRQECGHTVTIKCDRRYKYDEICSLCTDDHEIIQANRKYNDHVVINCGESLENDSWNVDYRSICSGCCSIIILILIVGVLYHFLG